MIAAWHPAALLAIFAAVSCGTLNAQDDAKPGVQNFPDRIKSFGGVPFGAPVEEAKKAWQLEAVEGASAPGDPVTVYLREDDSLVIGSLVAREVVYYFLDGKFYAVGFATPDSRQTTILREALTEGYGAPAFESDGGNSLVWPGGAVSAHLLVGASGEARVVLFSNELQPRYEQSLRDAAAKTAAGISSAGKGEAK